MAILVVGGSGFIGSVVSQFLSQKGHEVVGYDLIHTNTADYQKNWIRADILDMQSIERVFFDYNVDSIVHLVGLPAIDQCQRNPHFSFLLNVMSVQNTLEAMRMADIPKIVFASSATIYGSHSEKQLKETDEAHPKTMYGWHKLVAEEAIRSYGESYGIKSVILRLFNVYGGDPRLGKEVLSIFINRALRGETLLVKGPEKYRDFIHIEDVADAFAKAITKTLSDNITINVGTGTRTTLKQLALIVNSHFPMSKVVIEDSSDDGTGLYANIDAAKTTLGFAPRNPRTGISDHVKKYSDLKTRVTPGL